MVKTTFSPTWKRSVQPRKQRKYRYNAPLHVKENFLHATLSKPLREKHGVRSVRIKSGDKVKVMRGSNKKREGKIDRVSVKQERVFITGIETIKKEGAKVLIPFHASNLQIVELELKDKKRKAKLTKDASKKTEPQVAPVEKNNDPKNNELKKVEPKAELTSESNAEESK